MPLTWAPRTTLCPTLIHTQPTHPNLTTIHPIILRTLTLTLIRLTMGDRHTAIRRAVMETAIYLHSTEAAEAGIPVSRLLRPIRHIPAIPTTITAATVKTTLTIRTLLTDRTTAIILPTNIIEILTITITLTTITTSSSSNCDSHPNLTSACSRNQPHIGKVRSTNLRSLRTPTTCPSCPNRGFCPRILGARRTCYRTSFRWAAMRTTKGAWLLSQVEAKWSSPLLPTLCCSISATELLRPNLWQTDGLKIYLRT